MKNNGIHVLLLANENANRRDSNARESANALETVWQCIPSVLVLAEVTECTQLGVMDAAVDLLSTLGSRTLSGTPRAPTILQNILATVTIVLSQCRSKSMIEECRRRNIVLISLQACKSMEAKWITKEETVQGILAFFAQSIDYGVAKASEVERFVPLALKILNSRENSGTVERCFSLLDRAHKILNKTSFEQNFVSSLAALHGSDNDAARSKAEEWIQKVCQEQQPTRSACL